MVRALYFSFSMASLCVVGCGEQIVHTTYPAAPQMISPDCATQPWKIEGSSEDVNHDGVPKKRTITMTIDGQPVIKGDISPRLDGSGELDGTYKGKKINLTCAATQRPAENTYEVRCIVLIEDRRTVTLTF